jgi:Na+/phosphate symporter
MTNEEMLEDLKSFMVTTVRTEVNAALDAQLEAKLEEKLEKKLESKLDQKLDQKLNEKLAPIHQKIDDLTAFVQDAITTSNDANQEQLDNHEVRITKLEAATV